MDDNMHYCNQLDCHKNKFFLKFYYKLYQLNSDQLVQKDRAKDALSVYKKENFFKRSIRKYDRMATIFGLP